MVNEIMVLFVLRKLILQMLPYFMCANSEGSDETARMRRLAWAFAGRLCDKYHNHMSWLNLFPNCEQKATSLWYHWLYRICVKYGTFALTWISWYLKICFEKCRYSKCNEDITITRVVVAFYGDVARSKGNELPHDKTNNVVVRPAMTHISLGIRPVSQSLRCPHEKSLGP